MANRIFGGLLPLCLFAVLPLQAQNNNPFGSARGGFGGNNSAFNQNRVNNFNEYRQKINAEYISKTREKWNAFRVSQPLPVPDKDVKPAPPIKMNDEEARKKKEDRLIKIQGVIKPVKPAPRPQPVAPVEEVPEEPTKMLTFEYLATTWKARMPEASMVRLAGVSENAVADGWEKLCQPAYNNLVVDCLKLRSQNRLCDWEYLMMLQALSQKIFGNGTNEATLLMAFLYSQSGYKIRLGEAGGKLQMLYASQHIIYGKRYFTLDGDKFYPLNDKISDLRINEAKYPKEQSLSLWVPTSPYASYQASPLRELKARRYPDMAVKVSVNKNQLPFYDSYPTSEVGGNFMTRWAMYANTPICEQAQKELYPQGQKIAFLPFTYTRASLMAPSKRRVAPVPGFVSNVVLYQPTPAQGSPPERPVCHVGFSSPFSLIITHWMSFSRLNSSPMAQSWGTRTCCQSASLNVTDSAPTASPRWKRHPWVSNFSFKAVSAITDVERHIKMIVR